MPKPIILFLAAFVFSMQGANAQLATSDSLYLETAISRSNKLVSASTMSLLFNGTEHVGYFRGIKGTAYLESGEMTPGAIECGGIWYGIPMLYDLSTDQLIIKHFNGLYNIALVSDHVEQFILHDRVFKNLNNSTVDRKPVTGFHEELYRGDAISIYVKRKKTLKEESTAHGIEREFIGNSDFILRIDSVYHSVRSKSDFLDLMGDKRKIIGSYLRKNRLKFGKGRELSILQASKKYDEIR